MTTTPDALALTEKYYRLARRHTFPPDVPLAAVYRVDLSDAAAAIRDLAHAAQERDAAVADRDKLEKRVQELEAALHKISKMSHSDTCSHELTFAFHGCDCHVATARAALGEGEAP